MVSSQLSMGLRSRRLHLASLAAVACLCTPAVVRAQEETVSIPVSTYEDLLNRLDSLESRVSRTERRSAPVRTNGTKTSEGGYFAAYELAVLAPVYSNSTAFYTHDTVPSTPESAVLTEFGWNLEASHRFELGYLSPSTNLGWRARYWFFDGGASETSAADVDVKIGVADDPDIALDTITAGDPDFLQANASTAIDVVDFEAFSKRFVYSNQVTFSGGVRYANIQHNYAGFDVDPTIAAPNNIQTALLTDFNFEGVGPTVSLASRRKIGCSCWSWNAEGRTSLLFGQGDARWDRIGNSGAGTPLDPVGNSDVITQDNDLRIVPVAELRLGLDYRRALGSTVFEFGTGAEGQVWINGGTPMFGGQDGATDSDSITSPWTEDLGFIGFYLRGSARY
ncbi:MAG: Lpg1974 family pore-forming outer membrane protein [Planctomycetota bacterium]